MDSDKADRVGVKSYISEQKWVYQPDGESISDCLSNKEAALNLLSAMETEVEEGHLYGVQWIQ